MRLEVLTDPAHRGEVVRARLVVEPDVPAEVGLVCVSIYPDAPATGEEEPSMLETVTHQRWVELDVNAAEQIVDLPVPLRGPYSYESEALAFAWRVVGRTRRRFAPSETIERELRVLP